MFLLTDDIACHLDQRESSGFTALKISLFVRNDKNKNKDKIQIQPQDSLGIKRIYGQNRTVIKLFVTRLKTKS
jgi:hypothetical protein